MSDEKPILPSQAKTLDDVWKTLSPEPLIEDDEFQQYYRSEINIVRGSDKVELMARGLRRSFHGVFYKNLLMGHPGVGKSTELTRLARTIQDKFRVIRFSAQNDLDAAGFRPFDVLLAMMIRLAEETAKPVMEGGTGKEPDARLTQDIWNWFAIEKQTRTDETKTDASSSAGVKPSPISWMQLLGFFVELKGEIKYTYDRKAEITDYRLKTIDSLIKLLNRLLDECNRLLREATSQEWLFFGEDFDKPGIPTERIEELYLKYTNIFKNLNAHFIFTVPVALVYSEKASQLPLPVECIPDTPVFDSSHVAHKDGRNAVKAVLEARVSPELFEEGQEMRLIVASGGNLRDLFSMVSRAADLAALRSDANGKIGTKDAEAVINDLRTDYLRRLGTSPFDTTKELTYDAKVEQLIKIYHRKPGYDVPNPALYSLLYARAVQEFNGTRWFGVHPLVVDILKTQHKLTREDEGPILGGTD